MISEDSGLRATVADWLANLLYRPLDAAAVVRYRNPEAVAALNALAAELDCREAMATMRAALSEDASPETVALNLSVQYTRLFEGVAGYVIAPLYESAYTGTRLFDEAACDMAELVARSGMQIRNGCGEAPDHASVELALLASLLRSGDADNSARMEARLCHWIPLFVAACVKGDPDSFYGAAASMLGSLFDVSRPGRNDTNSGRGGADELCGSRVYQLKTTGNSHV